MWNPISPLDGRYAEAVSHLGKYFSEFALVQNRIEVELAYLEALAADGLFPSLSAEEHKRMSDLRKNFGEKEFTRIKEIEKTIRHDVKACELFLRETLQLSHPNLIHFALTSEDVNNLAYSLNFQKFRNEQQLPILDSLLKKLRQFIVQWRAIPFPARTHGQLASPTTAGKEMAVFATRFIRQRMRLRAMTFRGKLNGATGNYSAFYATFPSKDWRNWSKKFVERLGLEFNAVTTQVEDHDGWGEYFDLTRRINNILLDLDQDMWLYQSYGYFKPAVNTEEVGSSTMPHKVNPIRFENSEGNLEIANALLVRLSDKLSHSRMQRDLSDSTVERNIGAALAHSYLAMKETLAGLDGITLDEERCSSELDDACELLAEPFQTMLRAADVDDPYKLLKELTRGRSVSRKEIKRFIDGLSLDSQTKDQMSSLTVREYIGVAPLICDEVIEAIDKELGP